MAYLWPNKKEACCIVCFTLRQISPIYQKTSLYVDYQKVEKLLVGGVDAKLNGFKINWLSFSAKTLICRSVQVFF